MFAIVRRLALAAAFLIAAALPLNAAIITSMQQGTITMGSGSTSGTATISSVDTTKAVLLLNGWTSTQAGVSDGTSSNVRIAVTNATTITANRNSGTGNSMTVAFTVIEFAGGISSIQAGTITVSSGTTNTATISSVSSRAFVIWLGCTGANAFPSGMCSTVLTDATTVTATRCTGCGTATVGYMVVDPTSALVDSVQQVSVTQGSTTNTTVDGTISSVDTNRSIVLYNGYAFTTGSNLGFAAQAWRAELQAATNVRWTRNTGTNNQGWVFKATVIQFAATALDGNVQRGTIAISSATSNTATISSVTTARSFVNYLWFSASDGNANVRFPRIDLTNSTTVTANINSSGTVAAIGYEAIQFATAFPATGNSNFFMVFP